MRTLARRIALRLERQETVRLSVSNASSLSAAEVAAIQGALEEALRRAGTAAVEVRVTLSENVQGRLWAAEILRGGDRQVTMVTLPRPTEEPVLPPQLHLNKTLLWEQQEPILDAALAGDDALVVLEPDRLVVHPRDGLEWRQEHSIPLPRAAPLPRDARGRLIVEDGSFRAYLPGVTCRGVWTPEPSVRCGPEEPWPLYSGSRLLGGGYFAATRNYFDGRVVLPSGELKTVPAFFSVAAAPESEIGAWLFAGIKSGVTDLAGAGSDLTAMESSCGWHVLATRGGSVGEADAITAYAFLDRRWQPAGGPLEFPGPVTALWPDRNGSAALAVARSAGTGRYAAYRVAMDCGG